MKNVYSEGITHGLISGILLMGVKEILNGHFIIASCSSILLVGVLYLQFKTYNKLKEKRDFTKSNK